MLIFQPLVSFHGLFEKLSPLPIPIIFWTVMLIFQPLVIFHGLIEKLFPIPIPFLDSYADISAFGDFPWTV